MSDQARDELILMANEFASAMISKLLEKLEDGYGGYGDGEFILDTEFGCLPRLEAHVERLKKGEPEEVDIANFAMFLWKYRKDNPDEFPTGT